MGIMVVLAHPDKNSFEHALASTVSQVLFKNGHNVIFHDLYQERFDPVIPSWELNGQGPVDRWIQFQCSELSLVDGLIIIHPIMWGQLPAIMKGWVDRVFRPGVAYSATSHSGQIPEGLLSIQTAIVLNSSPMSRESENGLGGDLLDSIWKNNILHFCGVREVYRQTYYSCLGMPENVQWKCLEECGQIINHFFPVRGDQFKNLPEFSKYGR